MKEQSTLSKSLLLAFCVLFASQVIVSCAKEEAEAPVSDEIKWLTSLEEALETAKKRDRPVMIDFYADWCRWCERLDADTYVAEEIISNAERFVNVKLDADVERAISSKYKIVGLPTVLFLDPMGGEIHRIVGYRPPIDFLKEMNIALDAFQAKRRS